MADAYEALMSTNMGSVANMVLTLINTGNNALLFSQRERHKHTKRQWG